ncbi:ABC transporter permease [Planosporangium mesophilum]|uniref:Transport permease protein n=1 Tax=Planosporangium mesophilum TaxID=689768 RepID=A0A8J3WYG8_9ACTN|nr:ABC transporter permease [Planosporangium mesophilum]NJC81192.1 ABC transporter permease [Planosporangium mesophilum]GII21157.1 transport permease protein [Planosporangium mesophilum]
MKLVRDTWMVFTRQMTLVLRNPVWLIVGLMQPLYFLLLFGPLLKGALRMSAEDAYRFFVPGLLVQLAMFGTLFVGFGLIAELRAGVIERMRVTPVSRLALLLGRSLRDVVTLLVQAALLTVLALPFGLSVRAGDLFLAFALLALIALMLSAVSYALALKLRSEDALAPLMNAVSMPILLLSGILLPLSGWLKTVGEWNPFTYAVNASRALFAGDPGNANVWKALVIVSVLAVAAAAWAARSFARSVR